ncbi:hypothetical protein AN958_04631 [Leucoagaricus sp. SymC.cos]|nr:hypothetical protein AN958_04631 [Leucoagaricus sp. SymC.cos]
MFSLRPAVSSSLRHLRSFHTTSRRAAEKSKFLVYAPDRPNSVAHRYSVREAHLAEVKKPIEAEVAGMMVDPKQPKVQIGNEMRNNATASLLIIEAETIEEARELIESDLYWKKGVWDKERVIIQPFFSVTSFP